MADTSPKNSAPYYSPWKTGFSRSAKSIGSGIAKGITSDLGKGVAKGVGKSFGSFFTGWNIEKLDRNEYNFKFPQAEKEKFPKQTYYERQQKEKLLFSHEERRKEREIQQQIEAIRAELIAIVEEMRKMGETVLEAEKTIKIEMVRPGKYHVSMLERVRQILKLFRQQISESNSWLEMTFAKKRARRYWSMYKKKGTSFGLSGERAVSTTAG